MQQHTLSIFRRCLKSTAISASPPTCLKSCSSDFPSTDQLRNRLRRSANRLCKVFLGSVCHPIMHNRLAGIITRAARGFLFQRRRCRRIDMPRLIRRRQTRLNRMARFDDPIAHHVIGYVVRLCGGGGAIICDAIVLTGPTICSALMICSWQTATRRFFASRARISTSIFSANSISCRGVRYW